MGAFILFPLHIAEIVVAEAKEERLQKLTDIISFLEN